MRHNVKVLPTWVALLVATGVVVLTAATIAAILLWLNLTDVTANDRTTTELDVLKIGLSVGVGSGGVFALYLTARRQQSTERELVQRLDAQNSSEADANERRITELYTRAVDQLGSDKAVVRLAGLYAMERLAQGNSENRQTIVDVLCGYLRMPFSIGNLDSGSDSPGHDVPELQVRLTAQRILHRHLGPVESATGEGDPNYWGELDLDLTGATLVRFVLANASVRFCDFRRAHFIGSAQFQGTRFASTIFSFSRFDGFAWFESTSFGEAGGFDDTQFTSEATFEKATFGNSLFRRAHFTKDVTFNNARFVHNIEFDGVTFGGSVSFAGARARVDSRRSRVLPRGWILRHAVDNEPTRLETLVPQRWHPNAAVSIEERTMREEDQIWGYLDRS